jgi:hypothetical protein
MLVHPSSWLLAFCSEGSLTSPPWPTVESFVCPGKEGLGIKSPLPKLFARETVGPQKASAHKYVQ